MPSSERNMMGKLPMGATSYIIGNIIGSGIFITPTAILKHVESVGASLLIWVASAIIATLGAFCYVELGTSIRKSGGDFAYLCHVKWTAIAFSFMTCACIFTNPGTMAIQMETFSEYIVQGLQLEFNSPTTRFFANKLISFSLIMLLLFINFFSVRTVVARFQMVAMVAKLVAAAIIIITGLYVLIDNNFSLKNFEKPFVGTTHLPGEFVLALFAGLFSYDGWDILNYGAEDVKRPHRTMPFAIIVGMSTIALLYLSMNFSYFVVLSIAEMKKSDAVAMTYAAKSLGPLQYLMPFLVCIVLIGSLNATLFSGSRYIWAASRERNFPAFISCINREHDSPRAALFVHVLLSMAFSFLGNLEELISYVAFTHWIIRSFTMIALLCLRLGMVKQPVHDQAIRVPLILPIIFLIVCLTLVLTTIVQKFQTSLVGLVILSTGMAIYFLFIWEKSLSRYECFQRYSHQLNHDTSMIAQIAFNGRIELVGQQMEGDDNEEEQDKTKSTPTTDTSTQSPPTTMTAIGPKESDRELTRRSKGRSSSSSASTARVYPHEK